MSQAIVETVDGSLAKSTKLDPAAQIASKFHEFNSSKNGLSSDEAMRRLAQYGPNALDDHTESKWHKLLSYFWGPLPFLIEAAVVISALRRAPRSRPEG
jgi:H+-transporting ATPase